MFLINEGTKGDAFCPVFTTGGQVEIMMIVTRLNSFLALWKRPDDGLLRDEMSMFLVLITRVFF